MRSRIATGLTALLGGGIIAVGAGYLTDTDAVTSGFGVPGWSEIPRAAYRVKGVRDVASGVAPLVLLALGQRRALGWLLLAEALVPLGDMVTVLRSGGPRSAAYGIHGATAAAVLTAGGMLLSE